MRDEKLSAFLDGELQAHEIDDLLEQLRGADERQQLQRMAVARMALDRGQRALGQPVDISAAVAAAVRAEPLAPGKVRRLPRMKPQRLSIPAAGWAVAASIVFAAVLLVSQGPGTQTSTAMPLAKAEPTTPAATALAVRERPELLLPAQVAASGRSGATSPAGALAQTVSTGSTEDSGRELVIAAPSSMQTRWSSASSPAVQRQLDTLLINHARYGGGFALSGPLGYARVAAQGGAAKPAEGDR